MNPGRPGWSRPCCGAIRPAGGSGTATRPPSWPRCSSGTGRRRALAETAIMILVAVLLAELVRTFAFQTFYIPSSSMVPALGVYDRVVVQKAFFTWRDVREGNIVVFSHPPLDHCPGPDGDL